MPRGIPNTKFTIETDEVDAEAPVASGERLVTVQLLRDYVPAATKPDLVVEEQGIGKRARDVETEIFQKVPAGSIVELPYSEAKKCLEDIPYEDGRKDAAGRVIIARPAIAKITVDML